MRAEVIQHAEKQDNHDRCGENPLRGKTQVAEPRPRAQCGGDGEIRDEQEGADHGEQASVRACRGIHAAAAGEAAADDDVVEPDDEAQRADREDDGQRGKSHRGKSQTDDVGFARSPVAIEQCRSARPTEIAWTVNLHGSNQSNTTCSSPPVAGRPAKKSREN